MQTPIEAPDAEALRAFDTLLGQERYDLALNLLAGAATEAAFGEGATGGLEMPEFDRACRRFAELLEGRFPLPEPSIGFDRAANVYLATEFYQSGGHRRLLQEMIRARPQERHVVVFSGLLDHNTEYSTRIMAEAGALVVRADASLGRFGLLLWLREKLAAYVPRRIFLFTHPQDVIAHIAVLAVEARMGARLYHVRHADTRPALGADLVEATHLAIRPEQRNRLLAARPHLTVRVLPLCVGAGARSSARLLGRLASWARRPSLAPAKFLSATCGLAMKFVEDGPLAFGEIVANILCARGGRHVHMGEVPKSFRDAAWERLDARGIARDRLVFAGEVEDVAGELAARGVGLFVGSFPIGGGLSMCEAALAGVPVALHDPGASEVDRYVSGLTHAPPRHLVWRDGDELRERLERATKAELRAMAASSRAWYAARLTPERFDRRLDTLLTLTEVGRRPPARPDLHPERAGIVGAMFDGEAYLVHHPDVKAAGMDPLDHYLRFGEAETRSPMPLFDAPFYLSQLTEAERRRAARAPFTHYLLHGEAMGHHPHAFFDPAFCALAMGEADDDRSMIARYLDATETIRPHTFFDPAHYVRTTPIALPKGGLLPHFMDVGLAAGLSPHPLIEVEQFGANARDRMATLRRYLTKDDADANEVAPHILFDARWFAERLGHSPRGGAANLLWTYMICGNRSGRDPHPLVQAAHIEWTRPGTLVAAQPLLLDLAASRVRGDTHPLLSVSHIASQAPWMAAMGLDTVEYFMRFGTAHNIDPHPWFSSQYYLRSSPRLAQSGLEPLGHYIRTGASEGRNPAPFFDGQFYEADSTGAGSDTPGLLHYARSGARHFRPTSPLQEEVRSLTMRTARRFFEHGIGVDAAALLSEAMHPADATPHPTLRTETRERVHDFAQADSRSTIHPAGGVEVTRPSVVAQQHIAPVSGRYPTPKVEAGTFSGALVVAGNDGFATREGAWCDSGLDGFDGAAMSVKEHGAVVAVTEDRVLLRRHGPEEPIAEGILGTGTYSHNYFHFLVEVLPRLILAAERAPEGVPILVDGDMPAQHYQALALFMPDRPIRRLSRQFSYRVGRLHAATMPCIVHDALSSAPLDAVRYHPEALRRIAAMSRDLPRRATGRRLFLRRDSQRRRLVNAAQIEAALVEEGFEVVDCASMGFAEQILAIAEADVIVAQSGAQLANILFARPQTLVLALYSNVPGTNYYLWSGLGAILGLHVVNVVGWRIVGSAPGRDSAPHENFNVRIDSILPLLLKEAEPEAEESLAALLDRLFAANAEADVITAAWNLMAHETPAGFEARLLSLRDRVGQLLEEADEAAVGAALDHPFFSDFSRNTRSGFAALPAPEGREAARAVRVCEAFAAMARGAQVPGAEARRTLLLAMLLLPARRLPLIHRLSDLPDDVVVERYLGWLATPPFLFREGDESAQGEFVERLLDWLADRLSPDLPDGRRIAIARVAKALDLSQLLVMDQPLRGISRARNRVLEHLACRDLPVVNAPGDAAAEGRRIRIGIICRTFAKGPDSEAMVAMFHAFDRTRVEIFAYTVGFIDRVVKVDVDFDQRFDAVIDHRRHLNADPTRLRDQLAEDRLDVLLYANATTYGIGPLDLAMYRRIAPLQIVLNSHVPMSLGFPSFDFYLTGESDDPDHEVDQAEYAERLLRVPGPVINYLDTLAPREKVVIDRAAIGAAEDDVILMNAGSLAKLRHDCLRTMLRALTEVPRGLLVLAPYNPGWVSTSQAFAFNRQLREAAEEVGAPMDRIRILGEMSVAEAESALALCDVYLNPYPHGGATMTHLALVNGKPPVTLRRRSTRSIDQFLTATMGFEELLVSDADEYVALVRDLGRDPARRADLSARMLEAAKDPGFVRDPDWSRSMQAAILGAFEGLRHAPEGSDQDGDADPAEAVPAEDEVLP